MTYECLQCGQRVNFTAWRRETWEVDQEIIINGEGEYENAGDDYEIQDTTSDSENEDIKCAECGSDNVDWFEETPITNWREELEE